MTAQNNPDLLSQYHLSVKPFEQQLKWSCGLASLRMILYYLYGLDMTDRELAIVCGSNDNGTDEYDIRRGLKLLGFKFKESENGTLNKLKAWCMKDVPPLIHVVMPDGVGHYMVVCGYDKDNVYLCDPASGKVVQYGNSYFMGIWKEEELESQTRWFLVVNGYTKNKIGALINKLKHIKKKVEST